MTIDHEFKGVRVGILEDHLLLRDALARVLAESGLAVGFVAGNVNEAFDALTREPVDVVVLDLCLQGHDSRSGMQVLGAIRESHPQTHVVVLTGADSEDLAGESMAAGASAYVTKSDGSSQALIDAIHAAARGERRIPLQAVSHQGGLAASRPVSAPPSAIAGLTEREKQVLACIAEGHDNLKTSTLLGIAERTVKAHVSALYRKLNVENRVQLAIVARRAALGISASSAM